MSPFSFLSSFAFPTLPSISVPDIGSYLPENIQKRLVSYLLQRTLGRFVKKDGLQLERIEAEINQGRIRLEGLQIDVEVNILSLSYDFSVLTVYMTYFVEHQCNPPSQFSLPHSRRPLGRHRHLSSFPQCLVRPLISQCIVDTSRPRIVS
jgi:hypothetical protein